MGNWIPKDPTLVARVFEISASYLPPPPEGFVSPMRWGIERDVLERFSAAGVARGNIECERDTFTFNFNGPPSAFVSLFRHYYGPTMNAFEVAQKSDREGALGAELETLFIANNRSQRADFTSIPATFLRVTVTP